MLELDLVRGDAEPLGRCRAGCRSPRCTARWRGGRASSSAWVTIPTGLVKSTIQAPGAPRRRGRSASSRTTRHRPQRLGEAAGAGRLLADDAEASAAASRRRGVRPGPPTRSWMSTKSAPSMAAVAVAGAASAGRSSRAGRASAGRGRRRPRAAGSMSSRTARRSAAGRAARLEALDELRRVGAAATDDGDLDAHRPSSRAVSHRGLTRLLITLSAIARLQVPARPEPTIAASPPESAPVARGPPRPMARFRLELGPIPLHHQVYLDLQAALDEGEWRPGDRLPTERELARALRLQPDHRPAGARRARPRGAPGADARPRHVRPAAAHRPRLRRRPVVHRGDADARPGPGDAADRRPARVRRARRSRAALDLEPGSPTLYLERLRLADGEPLLLEQVHLPAERFPGLLASDLEHGSLYDLLTERYGVRVASGPRGPRAGPAARPRGAPARAASRARRRS